MLGNISYLVGSAHAKLADDMKRSNKLKDSSRIERVANKLNSYLCRQTTSDDSSNSSTSTIDLDFQLVKISCKKEYPAFDEKRPASFLKKTTRLLKLKWVFRCFIFILVAMLVGYAMFRIVEFCSKKLRASRESVVLNSKRNALDFISEWSGESIPSVYELEPITFFDSNNDGYGDLRGAALKLDYIKHKLKINCILVRNLQMNLPHIFGNAYELNNVDTRLGSRVDLRHFVNSAHEKSMKVILELDLTGTYFDHKLTHDLKNLYLTKNATEFLEERDKNLWRFNKETNLYYFSGDRENFAYFNIDDQSVCIFFLY